MFQSARLSRKPDWLYPIDEWLPQSRDISSHGKALAEPQTISSRKLMTARCCWCWEQILWFSVSNSGACKFFKVTLISESVKTYPWFTTKKWSKCFFNCSDSRFAYIKAEIFCEIFCPQLTKVSYLTIFPVKFRDNTAFDWGGERLLARVIGLCTPPQHVLCSHLFQPPHRLLVAC